MRGDYVSDSTSSFGQVQLFTEDNRPAALPSQATVTPQTRLPAQDAREHNVLVISGGGSDGAFGAGVLQGWSESGKRPDFAVVTGVSTGALIGNFAFLGPAWDNELRRFYTTVSSDQIYVSRGIEGLFQESLYDTTPLRQLITKVVTERLVNAVAEEHRKGRRFYVATTDLDLGQVVVWDMGGIAASEEPARYRLYREILVASTAIPGLFQPTYIPQSEGAPHMHVDGGVKAPILLRSFMIESRARRKNVYVLINGKVSLKAALPPVSPTFRDISTRSISELLRGLLYKTAYQAYVSSRQAGAGFRMIFVPDDEQQIEDALRFDPKEMKRLYALGERFGRDPANWLKEPPRLEALERVELRR